MLDRLRIAPDQRHLDVAAGTGEPGLSVAALAPRGGPGGTWTADETDDQIVTKRSVKL
jgi:ubiquinone/menaquinone biosynthesis C-methylase UbiE